MLCSVDIEQSIVGKALLMLELGKHHRSARYVLGIVLERDYIVMLRVGKGDK